MLIFARQNVLSARSRITVEYFEERQRYNTMNYKAMWEELKAKNEADLEYYKDGRMCSMMEMAHGLSSCEAILEEMEALEEKYGN